MFLNPLSLSPALWLSDTGTNPAQWDDLSGNGRHAVQATPANRPSIVSAALNGRQSRRFDGVDDFLALSSGLNILRNVAGATGFVVRKRTGTSDQSFFIASVGGGTNSRFFISQGNSGSYTTGARRLDADAGTFANNGTTTSNWAIQTGRVDYANGGAAGLSSYANGILTSSVAFNGTGNSSNTDSQGVRIGATLANTQFVSGDIAEILIFPTALSTADRQAVEIYLNAKWAIY